MTYFCSRCGGEIFSKQNVVGDGDGTGVKFAHYECFFKKSLDEFIDAETEEEQHKLQMKTIKELQRQNNELQIEISDLEEELSHTSNLLDFYMEENERWRTRIKLLEDRLNRIIKTAEGK